MRRVPPHDLRERTRLFALVVLEFCRRLPETREAGEAAGQLRRAANSMRSNYRAARIGADAALMQEARELASILATAVRTARKNTSRSKDVPDS